MTQTDFMIRFNKLALLLMKQSDDQVRSKNKSMTEERLKLKLWRILISFSTFKFWKQLLVCLHEPVNQCRAQLWTSVSMFRCQNSPQQGFSECPRPDLLSQHKLGTHQETAWTPKYVVTGYHGLCLPRCLKTIPGLFSSKDPVRLHHCPGSSWNRACFPPSSWFSAVV